MEEQLARVRDHDLHDVVVASGLAVLAELAAVLVVAKVGNRHETALPASVNSVQVGNVAESFLQELRSTYRNRSVTVGDHAVTLHLSEPQTTVSASTLSRLLVEVLEFASGSGVNLVVDHVSQSLVVGRPDEDLGLQLLPGERIEHDLGSTGLTSLPWRWYPRAWSSFEMSSTVTSVKAVPSALDPLKADTFEARHSIRWPIVILDGIA